MRASRILKNIFAKKDVLLITGLIILFNEYSSKLSKHLFSFDVILSDKYIFRDFKYIFLAILKDNIEIIIYSYFLILLVLSFLETYATYQINHKYILSDFKITIKSWFRSIPIFFFIKFIIDSCLLLISLTSFLIFDCIYQNTGSGYFYILMFIIAFVFIYSYAFMNFGALIALLPLTNYKDVLFLIFRKENLVKIFIFFFIRIFIEMLLVVAFPLLILKLNLWQQLIPICIGLGLSLPFAFFRVSAFELKLEILKELDFFKQYYKDYYGINPNNGL